MTMTNGLFQLIKLTGNISGNDIEDITITPALRDASKAIAFVSFNFSEINDHADTWRSWEILDENTLRIHGQLGDGGNANELDFVAYIIEFGVGVDSQQVSFSQPANGATPNTGTINPVNLSESMLVHSGHNLNAGDTTIGAEELERVRLLTSTSWEWEVANNADTGPQINRAQVIDWNDSSTSSQRGQATLPADTGSITITPPTAVDRTRSILFVSFLSDNGFSQDPDDNAISATINGSGDIAISRDDGTSVGAIEINWEIVEFPSSFVSVQHLTHTIPSASLSNTDTITAVGDVNSAFAISCVSVPFGFGNGESPETTDGDWGEATATINLTADDTVTFTKDTSASSTTIGYQVVEFLQTITEREEEFTVNAILVFEEKFTIDARLSALEEFTVDARLSALAEFTVDGRLAQRELFTVDARLSALAEFTVDGRLAVRELFTVDSRLSALAEFTIDSRLSALAEFDIDAFIELAQIVNFTVDGLIQASPMKFFLVDAFIQDTFVEDFEIDSRLSALAEFTIDGRLAQRETFTVDSRLSALEEFTVDGRIAQRELFTVDARLSALAEFTVDGRIAQRELFTVDTRLSALAEFTVDAELRPIKEFTVDSRLSALAEFTIDGRIAVRKLFTIDGRIAVRELFTVDAELRPIQEFTIDAFVQALDQEETFLIDARLKALTSVLVIVDGLVQKLNQEETFFVDALIQTENIDKTFLIDAVLKGEQEETFDIDAFIEETFVEDFFVDAFIKALDQEETFLVDAELANIIAETFLVDGLIQEAQLETFDVDAQLAERVGKDFTVDGRIAFRENFTIDATLSPRKTFTVDGKLTFTIDETFLINGILTVAGQKVFLVDLLIQNTFTETVQVDARIRDIVQETFFVDSFIQDTFTKTFLVDTRIEELGSKIFDVNAIIKALDTNKTFTVDTFSQETGSPKLITVDAFIQKTQTETTQVDAHIRDVIQETFIVDAFIQDTFTDTFSVDGILTVAGQKVFLVDTLIQTENIDKTFTVEAKIQVVQIRPWQIDAVLTSAQAKTFTVDAQIFLPTLANFTVDAEIEQPVSLINFTVDAELEELFTQVFTIDSILTVGGQKVFTVDGLTLGTQTKDFTVSANLRFENQEIFDIDALIQLTGDVLCAGQSGVIFNDDITTDTNWSVTGTQVLVDDPSFPNVIRMECLQSFFAVGTQQAVKQLDSPIINFKAQDLVFDFSHLQIFECTGGFRANGILELSETSAITAGFPQAHIRYRILSSGPQPTHFARLDVSDGTTTVVSSSFQLTNNQTIFPRISIVNNGTDARIEFFFDQARTSLASSIPDIDISSLTGKSLGFVQVASVGGGGGLRRLRGEIDNLLVTASRLCPEFRVDSVLRGEIEKNFTVDAVLVTLNNFTVDAILNKLGALQLFTIDAFIGTPEVTFTIDALLKTQGKFTVDSLLKQLGNGLCTTLSPIHEDDITTDTGWTVTGTTILIDDASFPNLMRWNKLQSRLNGGAQQAVKALDISINNHRTDLVWELDHEHFLQQLINFAGSGVLELTQTSTLTADASGANQPRISLRTFPTSQNFDETSARAEFSDGVNTIVTDGFELSLATHFYRISVFNDGTRLIFESFSDSARTIQEFQSASVDITSITGKPLNFIQAGSLGGGGSARIVNEEFDNFFILSGACPRFDIDARVKALNQEVLFTVDALLAVHKIFNVDAVIKKPGEVLCSILSNIFEDNISSDTGWTVTGTQVLVDDPSFPNVIRAECLVNSNTVVQQAVKPLDVSMINTRDMIWDVDYTAFDPCFASNGNLFISLTETDDRVTDGIGAFIRLRIFKSFANQFQVNVTSKGTTGTVPTTSFFSGAPRPRDFFLRVSILNGGTDLRLEVFLDSDRTNLQFTDTVDQTSIGNAQLNFIQVSNGGGATQASNQLRGEVDKFLIIGDGCPRFDIDSLIIAQASEETFTVDAKLIRPPNKFTVDAILLETQTKVFRVDGIAFVVPARLFTIDALLQPFIKFDVDAVLFQVKQTFDFTVDAFIQRTGEQLCDPSQITSFPDFTEDFSTYTNQTEADTAWVPQDISTAQVDITNDVLGVIQVSDTSNDANIFSNGLSPDSNEWVLRWKLVISSITFTAGGTCEGFFGWSAGGTTGGSSNQKSIGVQMRYGTNIGNSQFRANISNAINPIFPPQPGGNMATPPDVGTFFFEMIRTGPLGMEVNIYSDANFTNLIEHTVFSLGFFGSTPSGLGYKNNQLTNTGSIDYTIDDIEFWNGISDVSISSCPRFNVDAVIQTPTIDKEFIVDAVIKTLGENGTCNFFPGTNFAIDTGLEQFIGPIQPAHELLVEQLVGQEVTLSNQQVRSVNFLLRSSNFPNEITTNMPINAEIWSDVVIGNLGGETTEAVSTTVIDASNTSGDLPPGDWTLVKFEFDINTTPFLTGDFVVGYKSLSSVFSPAGVGTAIPVISNSNVIPGSAVHRKGANSGLGDLDEWIFLTTDQKDMIIQLEVVNGDEIILGVGKQCPPVDAILVNVPNKFLIDAIVVRRFTNDFTIDGLIDPPVLVPFLIDGFLIGTKLPFSVDSILIPSQVIFTVDGILTGAGQKVFLIDAVLQPFIEFEIDGLIQALETKSPKFNLNALLVVEDREIDFTVDGSTKFFDKVAPFTIDAFVIFFPSKLPFVDGIIKELGALQPFTVDAFIQQLDFNFIRTIDALLQKSVGKNFLADALIETKDTEEDFTIDARLSVKAPPFLFTVDAFTLLENHRWQTDALLQKRVIKIFTLDGLIVALPQKLFLVDASTLGTIDEEFIIDGLIEIEAQEPFLVDGIIFQINTIDFTVDAIIKGVGLTLDFTVDASLVRIGEFTVDSFVKATQIKTFTIDARVGRFEKEIIGVDAIIKAFNQEKEFTVDAKVAFVKEAGFTVDTQLIGSQDFTVSAFVGDTLFTGLEVESVIVENNSNEGVESVIVENNSDEGVESVIGQDQ